MFHVSTFDCYPRVPSLIRITLFYVWKVLCVTLCLCLLLRHVPCSSRRMGRSAYSVRRVGEGAANIPADLPASALLSACRYAEPLSVLAVQPDQQGGEVFLPSQPTKDYR